MTCLTCPRLQSDVTHAKGAWFNARKKLIRAQFYDERVEQAVADVDATKAALEEADAKLADHRADCEHVAPPPAPRRGGARTPITPAQTQQIQDRVRAGEKMDAIAEDMGISRATVSAHAAAVRDEVRGFLFAPQPWAADALCAQTYPEEFFPDKQGSSSRAAKAVCAGCTVAAECLTYALDNDEKFGVWGGTSPKERRALRRLRDAS